MCQEDYFADQMVEAELKSTVVQEAHEDDKRQWELTNAELKNRCTKLEDEYERQRLDLLVVEAKLMQAEGSATAQIIYLRKQLEEAQYMANMDEEKIKAILKRHRINTFKLVSDSLDKGWQT